MKKNLVLIIGTVGLALVLDYFSIRICPIFNAFKIPCPGCGITRAVKLLLQGKILESFRYNVLPIPIFILIVSYILMYIFKKDLLIKINDKYKYLIIILAVIITIIVWIININNPRLY